MNSLPAVLDSPLMTDTNAQSSSNPAQIAQMVTLSREGITAGVSLIGIIAILMFGWRLRDQYYLTPESGPGYALGIIGAAFMLLLLLYPLRKHARWTRRWGQIKYWFRAHMVFGNRRPAVHSLSL